MTPVNSTAVALNLCEVSVFFLAEAYFKPTGNFQLFSRNQRSKIFAQPCHQSTKTTISEQLVARGRGIVSLLFTQLCWWSTQSTLLC